MSWSIEVCPADALFSRECEATQLLVHYELGGIGHSYCVLLFKVDPQNRLQFVWGGAGSHGAKNLDQLRTMVAAGQFSDEMQNYW